MSAIYIHIPFCRVRCIYCNFHMSIYNNTSYIKDMIDCLKSEIILNKNFLKNNIINTIYFGGGTPSIIDYKHIYDILNTIINNYSISNNIEITIECNPEDLSKEKLNQFYKIGINRLSIGVQSFNNEDLNFMKRSHNGYDAYKSIINAQNIGFTNISIDLIYGLSNNKSNWEKNIQYVLDLKINHLSAYALTIEKKTHLDFLKKKNMFNINEYKQVNDYKILIKIMKEKNFIHYEFSNFGKKGFMSIHNINYWKYFTSYLGIGPSSYSFKWKLRKWNINNNILYMKSIKKKIIPYKYEILSLSDMYNEYIMTGLRTMWGVNITNIKNMFGDIYYDYLINNSKILIKKEILFRKKNNIIINQKYWIFMNKIISEIFFKN